MRDKMLKRLQMKAKLVFATKESATLFVTGAGFTYMCLVRCTAEGARDKATGRSGNGIRPVRTCGESYRTLLWFPLEVRARTDVDRDVRMGEVVGRV